MPDDPTEPAHAVMFESNRFPGVLVLYFHLLPRGEERPPEPVNVAIELRESRPTGPVTGSPVTGESTFELEEQTVARRATGGPFRVDADALERIALDYRRYEQIAHTVMQMEGPWPSDDERRVLVSRARRKGRGRRGLDAEFFRILAEEVRERRRLGDTTIATTLARMHHVDRSTASRWLKRLEADGYLSEGDG